MRLGAPPIQGFRLTQLAVLVGLAAIAAGLVGLRRGRRAGAEDGAEHRAPLLGIGLGAPAVAVGLVLAVRVAALPMLNDVTTNPESPPDLAGGVAYPAAFAPLQREAYPDVGPIKVRGLTASEAFQLALDVAAELGWTVVSSNVVRLTFEATDESPVFRFVDDVAVSARSAPGAAYVDVRSRSRVGRSDLGANAARIREFRTALRARAG